MIRSNRLTHQFVEFIPDKLEEATVYVSTAYATAVHLCCCGCQREIVTPISPTGWTLSFDGESISLDPSIGNWSLPCKSHYWIRNNRVRWAKEWSRAEIDAGRARERVARDRYFKNRRGGQTDELLPTAARPSPGPKYTLWRRLKHRLRLDNQPL